MVSTSLIFITTSKRASLLQRLRAHSRDDAIKMTWDRVADSREGIALTCDGEDAVVVVMKERKQD